MLAPRSSGPASTRVIFLPDTRVNPVAFLVALGAALLAAVLPAAPALAQTADDRPNIIVLFTDDMGYGDLSSYGHPTIQTPQLDRMADEGLRLTSFYVAASVCTPSRAGLLPGRYPIRHLPNNLGPESTNSLPLNETLVGEPLQEAGYRTAMIGKWHLGHARDEMMPSSRGFDDYYGLLYSND
ncbi:MAG: sulfatase-like hydrolase/transferase, partial [Rhodothermales bacterium]